MISEKLVLSVPEIIGSPLAMSSRDGQVVHGLVCEALEGGRQVILDFAGVSNMTSAFLNTAIGQLYGRYRESVIRSQLEIANVKPSQVGLVHASIRRAKEYFNDPEGTRRAYAELAG